MRRSFSPRQRGFSLLEILITLVVLGGGLLAIGNLYGKVMSGSAAAKERSEAVVQAEKKLEELRYATYASITSGSDSVNAVTGSGSSANYSRSWTVTASASPAYKDVQITVSWNDSHNQSQSAVLTSRISGIDPAKSAALIATATTTSTTSSTTTSSTTSSSSTTSTTASPVTTSTSTTTTTTAPATTTTTTSTTTTTTTTAALCTTTVSGNNHNNWDTPTSSPTANSCTYAKTTYSCTVNASYGTTITITETNGANTYKKTTTANCATQTSVNPQ